MNQPQELPQPGQEQGKAAPSYAQLCAEIGEKTYLIARLEAEIAARLQAIEEGRMAAQERSPPSA